jgi:Domain of Unknown Function (DUF913)
LGLTCDDDDLAVSASSSSSSSSAPSSSTASSSSSSVIKVTTGKKMLLHSLLKLCSTYFEDANQDGPDSGQAQVIRGLPFARVFVTMFKHSSVLTSTVMTLAYTILSDVICSNSTPSVILVHMLGNAVARQALCGISASQEFSVDSILSMVNVISALSITDDGVNLVRTHSPFEALFTIFHQAQYVYPESQIMIGDLPGLFGSSVEELLRHHPALSGMCIGAVVKVLNDVGKLALEDNYSSSYNVDFNRFLRHMSHATAILSFLEPILGSVIGMGSSRKQVIAEFINYGGVEASLQLVRGALGPPRFLLTSLSCSVDPIPNSLGFSPVMSSLTRCFGLLAEHEPESFFKILVPNITSCGEKLKSSLKEYYASMKGEAALDASSEASSYRLRFFLDTVQPKPLQDVILDSTDDPDNLIGFLIVLRDFVTLNYMLDSLVGALNQRPFLHILSPLFTKSLELPVLIKSLVDDLYRVSQAELCRIWGSAMYGSKANVKAHPMYKLLVVSQDSVVVREAPDESSKEAYELEYGTVVYANERVSKANGLLRYHLEDGWVGYLRDHNSTEPQILVVDVLPNNGDTMVVAVVGSQSRLDFEKFANVHLRRAGFIVLLHYHGCIRRLLQSICQSFVKHDLQNLGYPSAITFSEHLPQFLPIVMNCLIRLTPDVDAIPVMPLEAFTEGTILSSFFVTLPIPDMERFDGVDNVKTIYAVELCNFFLSEERGRTRAVTNSVLLAHMFSTNLLEKILCASTNAFLSCLLKPEEVCPFHYFYRVF